MNQKIKGNMRGRVGKDNHWTITITVGNAVVEIRSQTAFVNTALAFEDSRRIIPVLFAEVVGILKKNLEFANNCGPGTKFNSIEELRKAANVDS